MITVIRRKRPEATSPYGFKTGNLREIRAKASELWHTAIATVRKFLAKGLKMVYIDSMA